MAVHAKIAYCLRNKKMPTQLPNKFDNGIKLFNVLTLKHKIAYLALNSLSRFHKKIKCQKPTTQSKQLG